jgi:hypothetical protein
MTWLTSNLVTFLRDQNILISINIFFSKTHNNSSVFDEDGVENQAAHSAISILKRMNVHETVAVLCSRHKRIDDVGIIDGRNVGLKIVNHSFHGLWNVSRFAELKSTCPCLLVATSVSPTKSLGRQDTSFCGAEAFGQNAVGLLDGVFTQRLIMLHECVNDMLEGCGMLHNLAAVSDHDIFAGLALALDELIKLGLVFFISKAFVNMV